MESKTKLRILYLYKHLLLHSDAEHPIATKQLIADMRTYYDLSVSRNTLADDIAMLQESGINIEVIHSQSNSYYIDRQSFELAELKLLIDAVSSSKFITRKKSETLINKLCSLTSENNSAQLRRHVYVAGRVKAENEKGYYIVDVINEAIDTSRKISFQYTDFSTKKRRVLRHDGESYIVSPYALIWDGDYYYVIGYSEKRGIIQCFRLDRIYKTPEILNEKAVPAPKGFSVNTYSKAVFRMYDTDQPIDVELLCKDHIMNSIVDHFGKEIRVQEVDEEHFTVKVKVCASPTFYRWVFGWNGDMKILAPEDAVAEYKAMARKALE